MNPINDFHECIDTTCNEMKIIASDLTNEIERLKTEVEGYKYLYELMK